MRLTQGQAAEIIARAAGRTEVAFVNRDGKVMLAARDAEGFWTLTNLSQRAGLSNTVDLTDAELSLWADTRRGTFSVLVSTDAGLMLFQGTSVGDDAAWTVSNITAALPAARAIDRGLTVLITAAGLARVFGFDAGGALLAYTEFRPAGASPSSTPTRFVFTVVSRALRPGSLALPRLTGDLAGVLGAGERPTLGAVNAAGKLITLSRSPITRANAGARVWEWSNVSQSTRTPVRLVGDLAASRGPANSVLFSGIDARGRGWTFIDRAGAG